MTTSEMSVEFDVLYNNIMSNAAPGLSEYEKSIFLTKAQEAFISGVYAGTIVADSFEQTEEMKVYVNTLVKQSVIEEYQKGGIDDESYIFPLPEGYMFIVYQSCILNDEALGCLNGTEALVIPVTHDNLYKIRRNPFTRPNERRVMGITYDNKLEILSKYNIKSLLVRYIQIPEPVILEDLEDGLTINNKDKQTECKLNPITHRMILNIAVQLAKSAWGS